MANTAHRWVARTILVAGIGMGVGVATFGTAAVLAAPADYVGTPPPSVPRDPVPPRVLGRVESRSVAVSASQPIPITGGDVAALTVVGLGCVAAGTVLVRRGRKPRVFTS